MSSATVLVDGLAGTRGCRYNADDDRFYAVELTGRVLSVGRDRDLVVHAAGLGHLVDIVLAPGGTVAFVSGRTGTIHEVDLRYGEAKLITDQLNGAGQLAWIASRACLWVVEADRRGGLIEVDPSTGDATRLTDELGGALGLAARSDGTEAFITRPREIARVDPAAGTVDPFAQAPYDAGFLAWDENEQNLLVSDGGPAGRVTQLDPSATETTLVETADLRAAGVAMARGQLVVGGYREIDLIDLDLVAPGPQVTDLSPLRGYAGDVLTVSGSGFGDWATPVFVKVGGVPAILLEHNDTRLRALTHPDTLGGNVKISVGPDTVVPGTFEIDTAAGFFDDGPPIVLMDAAAGSAGGDQGLPKSGGSVFVALVTPSDLAAPAASARTTIDDRWNGSGSSVATYYEQASFNNAKVKGSLTAGWKALSGVLSEYFWHEKHKQKVDGSGNPVVDSHGHAVYQTDAAGNPVFETDSAGNTVMYDNFWDVDRLVAEAVSLYAADIKAANPDMIAVTCYTGGKFVRAWGNLSKTTFAYSSDTLNISVALAKDTAYITVNEDADWGRLAHETGHNIIDPKFVAGAHLGEDIYASDLIDPSEATAAAYDIMGSHDGYHALFSGSNLENLGWLNDAHADKPNDENVSNTNIARIKWDRNPRVYEAELVAHALNENTLQNRYHVLKIIITPSLAYYVQVRQRPGPTGQVFDPIVPLGPGAANDGGVIVTRVLLDTVNNNQQTRFITLAHGPNVLLKDDTAVDPLRDLTITVIDDAVQARPLVCKVRVEWGQNIPDDPTGKFDLRIAPIGAGYESPDIWVDRGQDGVYDKPKDGEGRPMGNGDKPMVLAKNDLYCRVHNDGSDKATNVQVTFYSVTPPGVGDNGSWAPIETVTVGSIDGGKSFDASTVWVPQVGEHTCLQVAAGHQLGEITGGNNLGQENVFDFDLSSSSPVRPLTLPVAIRNPSPRRERIHLRTRVLGRARGYIAQIPHQWVWVDGHGERIIELVLAAPDDVGKYVEMPPVDVQVSGYLERRYTEALEDGGFPGEYQTPIGGLTARCKAKPAGEVVIEAGRKDVQLWVAGRVTPGSSGLDVHIVLAGGPDGDVVIKTTRTTSGGSFQTTARLDAVVARHRELDGMTLDVVAVLLEASFVAEARSVPRQIQL